MCMIEFLLGIPCVFQGGIYILQIMDWYCATFSLMLLSLTEVLVISWIYGVNRFYKDIELMIGYKPSVYWKVLWCFVTPATILFIWIFSVSQLAPVTYGTYNYPTWAIVFGWGLGLISLLPLPVVAIHSICKEKGTLWQRIKKLSRPADNWGPALPENREEWLATFDANDCRRPQLAFSVVSQPIYSPKKASGAAPHHHHQGASPEQRNLLSDSVQSDLPLGASADFTSMFTNGQKPPVSNC
ncbi:hypothetical protein BaRGS_00008164 [Batillaria attramentaria]|uniref:Uncharacterized protein n=1 Tax=Batillaria attramentaria TaxID=370345 RepID=A0ABD0LNJ4_9CAEN